jgi:ssDNA-binding Zn-finger/Zn-ribbon topoisomerase 1
MLKRTGSFGPFCGCSQFPPCRATQKRAECDSARG